MMFLTKRFNLGLVLMLFCILLSACGPSPEELSATSSAETAAAASPTPLPTSTPTPAFTPTPTPTLTPTPLPGPDAKAMINWEALNLPEGYLSFDAHELGFGEGDWIMAAQMEDGTQIDYYIENSFIFAEQWPEAAYGWTVIYPTEFDKDVLDAYIESFPDQLAGIIKGFGASLISLVDNTEYSDIGDNSAEAWAVYVLDGNWWSFWGATFRIDNIGGFVFLRHSFGDEQFIEIGDLAQIYAQSIEIPTYSCNFTTITPDSDSDLPAFEYKVEGFYPGEPIMVSLSGDVRVDGETQRVTAIDYDTDLTDENGMFHGKFRFGDEVLELASSEFELIIISYSSNCTIRQIVTWTTDLTTATEDEFTPTIMPTEESISVQEKSRRVSQIQERGIIQIGVRNDDMYPMNFKEESKHKGFEIDLAIEIVSRLFGDELDIEWIPLSAQERIEAVQNDEVDFLIRNLTHTKSRAELVLFSSTYFLEGGSETEPLAIAVSQADPIFRNNIDRILLEIIEDGTWQIIYDRWIDDPPTWTIEFMLSVPPANR